MAITTRLKKWYVKYERLISSLSLVGGFIFNALTLKRVDLFWENFWVIIHLLIAGICIVFINREENVKGENDPESHFILLTILQFMFGGLLSTYLVFYFRSTTFSVTWPFLVLLAIAFIINERGKRHSIRAVYQISFFFLSLFSFFIFIIPVIFHTINTLTFLASGLASLVVMKFFIKILNSYAKVKFEKNKNYLKTAVLCIYITINILFFAHLIPPIPLSLKDAGIYHSLTHDKITGKYVVTMEKSERNIFNHLVRYFAVYQDIHVTPGASVYFYNSIFSPDAFHTDIVHEWSHFDEKSGTWESPSKLQLGAIGGREAGYRTYSQKWDLAPGKWKVNAETKSGQVIGQLRFRIIPVSAMPELVTEVK